MLASTFKVPPGVSDAISETPRGFILPSVSAAPVKKSTVLSPARAVPLADLTSLETTS